MDFERYLRYLQGLIGYEFKKPSLLALALTAAGAEGNATGNRDEQTKYDGNRRLAQYGDSIAQFIIIGKTLFEDDDPDRDKALKSAKLKEHMEKRARMFQLDTHMKLNIRQKGEASKRTLSTAINAIFGACYLDSRDISVVRSVIDQFGLGVDDEQYVDPITNHGRQYVFGGEVTTGIFNSESPMVSTEITSTPPFSNRAIIQGLDWDTSLHQLDATEDTTYSQMPEEMDEIFELLPSRSTTIIGEGFGDITNETSQQEMSWEDEFGFPLSLEEPATISGATSSSSTTVMENDEESSSSVQNIGSINTDEIVPIVAESARRREPRGSASQIERQSTRQIPGRISLGNNPAKRKYESHSKTKAAQLDAYVSKQKEHCQERGLPCPEEGFQEFILSPNTPGRFGDMIPDLKILYFAIASPESVAALQAYVKVGKGDDISRQELPQWNLSVPNRMLAIEELDKRISYMALIRRCHIHQLYLDSSIESRKTSDGFVLNTPRSISSQPNPAFGNPNNLEDSRVSAAILDEIYPDLKKNSAEYQKKLRSAKKVRRLGQRLDRFVKMWGYGIIGLLPLVKDMWDVDASLEITDSLILRFTDPIFEEFVQRFNQSQGDFLRKMSAAVSEVVKAIAHGRIDPSTHFGIENLGQEQILNEPRGSHAILNSISSIAPYL